MGNQKKMNDSKATHQDTKKVFWKSRTCSRSFFHILNREFGYPKETEEHAANPLAGGIRLKGYQCGMLWGASLAVGAESFRRCDDRDQAIAMTIRATQHLMESFSKRAESVNCRDITSCDFTSKLGIGKYIFSGKFISCITLAEQWAPEAIQSAKEGLSHDQSAFPQLPISCASEVARKMGATAEEMVMVAGFAGGLGLSGNACGALSAAIWMNALARHRKKTGFDDNNLKFSDKTGSGKPAYPSAKDMVKAFYDATDSKILCHEISEQYFNTIGEHTEFIKNGGCGKLITALASLSCSSGKENVERSKA